MSHESKFFLKGKCFWSNKIVSKWREKKEALFCNEESKIYDCHWYETWDLNDGKYYKKCSMFLSWTLSLNKEGQISKPLLYTMIEPLTTVIFKQKSHCKRQRLFRITWLHTQWTVYQSKSIFRIFRKPAV